MAQRDAAWSRTIPHEKQAFCCRLRRPPEGREIRPSNRSRRLRDAFCGLLGAQPGPHSNRCHEACLRGDEAASNRDLRGGQGQARKGQGGQGLKALVEERKPWEVGAQQSGRPELNCFTRTSK